MQQFFELQSLLILEVASVSEQQPATSFHYFASRLVVSKLIGLIDPDTVNHFPSELCYNVEQVIDHPCLWAVVLNFQVHGGIHIHRHGFDLATGFRPQPFKEGAYRCSTAAFSNPEDLLSIRINRHGGVAVSLEQGELIHDQSTNPAFIWLSHFSFEAPMVDGLDRMPMQP